MVEPFTDVSGSPSALALDSPVLHVDRKLATRRTGLRDKGEEAHLVLAGMGIETVGDLLRHYPRRYIDRSAVERIRDLRVGEQATVIARVHATVKRLTRRRQSMVTVTISDGTGKLDLTFFNQPWAAGIYKAGLELAVSGTVTRYRGRLQLANQEAEILGGDERELVHTGRITPVHRASDGIATRTIRELVFSALERLPSIPDPIPLGLIESEGLEDLDTALRRVHFPDDAEQLARAIERLKFDELFTLELGVALRKHRLESERAGIAHQADGDLTDRLLATLPFEPTKAQTRAIEEVGAAMAAGRPMNVLLQGDVGSGKTLVAVSACLMAIQSGHQAAIMAPTEVLATQHARSVAALLGGVGAIDLLEHGSNGASAPHGQGSLLEELAPTPSEDHPITYASLTAAVTGKDRARILAGVADGGVDLVIGTHALVQEAVSFADLSLAVVDEQHRFGLHQRMALKGKGEGDIDVVIMTATPIPRTLALTYYGDLDVVVLDEMPKGRQPIGTAAARTDEERAAAYDLIRREVGEGRQAFVVCAAIDEGNRSQVRAAEAEAERLADGDLPRSPGRAPARAHATQGQGSRDGRLPLRSLRRVDLHHGDRGGRRRPERDRDARRERRTVRSRAAPSAPWADRPRHARLVLRPVRRVRGDEPGCTGPDRSDDPDDRRVRARGRGPQAPRRGHAVRYEAVGHARPEARPSRRGLSTS